MKKIYTTAVILIILVSTYSYGFNQDSLTKIYNSDKYSKVIRYEAIKSIASYYYNLNADSSVKYLNTMIQFCKANSMNKEYNTAMANLGFSLIPFGRYEEARNLLNIAKNNFIKEGDMERASYCHTQLARIYVKMDLIVEAYKEFKKGQSYYNSKFLDKVYRSDKKFYKSLSDSCKNIINIYMNIMTDYGLFLYEISDYKNSIIIFDKIQRFAEISDNYNRLSGNYVNQASVYIELNKYKIAFEKLQLAIDISEKLNNTTFNIIAKNTLANSYLELGRLKEAEPLLIQNIAVGKKVMFPRELCASLMLYSDLLFKKKLYKLSYQNAIEAYSIAKNMKYIDHQIELCSLLVISHIVQGNKDSALYYINCGNTLKKKIEKYNQNYKKQLFITITSLEQKEKAETAALEKQKLNQKTILLLLALLIITLVVLVLIIFALRMRNNSNKSLKELNAMKNRFFSIVAHDLMSPVAINKQTWELFRNNYKELDSADIDSLIISNTTNSVRLYELTNNLLMWARTMMKESSIILEETNFSELLDNQLDLLQVNINEKSINFKNKIDKNLWVNCDKNVISFVIRNILANAIKFTNNNGEVSITSTQIKNKCLVSVRDNGIGMDELTKQNLFTIKDGAISYGTNQEKGTGLGLVLCKEFLDLHKSKIFIESELERGTTISFELEIAKNNDAQKTSENLL